MASKVDRGSAPILQHDAVTGFPIKMADAVVASLQAEAEARAGKRRRVGGPFFRGRGATAGRAGEDAALE